MNRIQRNDLCLKMIYHCHTLSQDTNHHSQMKKWSAISHAYIPGNQQELSIQQATQQGDNVHEYWRPVPSVTCLHRTNSGKSENASKSIAGNSIQGILCTGQVLNCIVHIYKSKHIYNWSGSIAALENPKKWNFSKQFQATYQTTDLRSKGIHCLSHDNFKSLHLFTKRQVQTKNITPWYHKSFWIIL